MKTSLEAEVHAKDSVTAESIDDKNGSPPFPVSTSVFIYFWNLAMKKLWGDFLVI